MKPLKQQYRLYERVILEVLNKTEWHKIHWEVEFPAKWRIIDPISNSVFVALSDIIDKILIDEISSFKVK